MLLRKTINLPYNLRQLAQAACPKDYTVLAYLGDFLIIEQPQLHCRAAFDMLVSLQEFLGFAINRTNVVIVANA